MTTTTSARNPIPQPTTLSTTRDPIPLPHAKLHTLPLAIGSVTYTYTYNSSTGSSPASLAEPLNLTLHATTQGPHDAPPRPQNYTSALPPPGTISSPLDVTIRPAAAPSGPLERWLESLLERALAGCFVGPDAGSGARAGAGTGAGAGAGIGTAEGFGYGAGSRMRVGVVVQVVAGVPGDSGAPTGPEARTHVQTPTRRQLLLVPHALNAAMLALLDGNVPLPGGCVVACAVEVGSAGGIGDEGVRVAGLFLEEEKDGLVGRREGDSQGVMDVDGGRDELSGGNSLCVFAFRTGSLHPNDATRDMVLALAEGAMSVTQWMAARDFAERVCCGPGGLEEWVRGILGGGMERRH